MFEEEIVSKHKLSTFRDISIADFLLEKFGFRLIVIFGISKRVNCGEGS